MADETTPPDADPYDDDYDDEYDDEYQDDDYGDEYERAAAAAKRRRDTTIVIAVAAVILVIVVIIVAQGGSKSNDQGKAPSSGSSSSSSSGPVQKHWQDDHVNHPPAGMTGQGDLDPAGGTVAPGLYFWSTYDGWHIRLYRGAAGTTPGLGGAITINVRGTSPTDPKVGIAVKKKPDDVTATNAQPGDLTLNIPAGTEPMVPIDLDINGFNDKLTWTFTGINPNLVIMGSSTAPIPTSPFTITKV